MHAVRLDRDLDVLSDEHFPPAPAQEMERLNDYNLFVCPGVLVSWCPGVLVS